MQLKQSLALCRAQQQTGPVDQLNKDASMYQTIRVSSSVEMARNEQNRRFYFRATEYIPVDETVIIEEPSLFLLKRAGLDVFCTLCLKPCGDTFWPCSDCSEVVFCSEKCSTAISFHRAECGIVGLLQKEVSSRAAQTYPFLVQSGHDELINVSTNIKSYSPSNYFPNAQTRTDIKTSEAAKWF